MGLVGLSAGVGCGDSSAPFGAFGKYTLSKFEATPEGVGSGSDPLFPGISVHSTMDSLQDSVILHANGTYKEVGALWGTSMLSGQTEEYPIDVRGTYTLNGTALVLTPNAGQTIAGGKGTLKAGTLTFDRYPGLWEFVKR